MIAVLLNPRAGGARRDPGLPRRLAAIVGGRGEVHVTSAEGLPALADALCRSGVALIALCGGDGTGQATLTELTRAYGAASKALPSIALLRGGTVNTVSRNLGVAGAPEDVLARLITALDRGAPLPTVSQALLSVNGRRGFLFAAALGARFLELYYEAPAPGPARALWLAARCASSAATGGALAQRLFRPARVGVTIDDAHEVQLDARLLVASTVSDVGIGMRVCPRATSSPGHFQIVASALPPSAMARQLHAVLAGRAIVGPPEQHLDRLARRAALRFEHPEPYTIDGELFRADALLIERAETLSIVRV